MSIAQSLFNDFGNVEITQFCLHVSIEEDVGALHIPVQYLSVVKGFQSSYDLYENIPDFLFFDVCFPLLVVAYFLKNVSIVSIFHDQTIYKNEIKLLI